MKDSNHKESKFYTVLAKQVNPISKIVTNKNFKIKAKSDKEAEKEFKVKHPDWEYITCH